LYDSFLAAVCTKFSLLLLIMGVVSSASFLADSVPPNHGHFFPDQHHSPGLSCVMFTAPIVSLWGGVAGRNLSFHFSEPYLRSAIAPRIHDWERLSFPPRRPPPPIPLELNRTLPLYDMRVFNNRIHVGYFRFHFCIQRFFRLSV